MKNKKKKSLGAPEVSQEVDPEVAWKVSPGRPEVQPVGGQIWPNLRPPRRLVWTPDPRFE